MGAGLHRLAVFEHRHLVGVLGVGHAMGDHDHRLAAGLRQFADCVARISSSDSTSTLLVASSNTNTGEYVAGARRAMAMRWRWPPDEVGVRRTRSVMPRPSGWSAHEVGDAGLLEHVSQRRESTASDAASAYLAVIGQGHQKVLPRRCAGKQMAAGTDQGDGSGQCLAGQVGCLGAVQRERASVSGQRTGEQRGGRGLAGTGDADDGGELTGP